MPFTSGGVGYGSVGFLQGERSAQEKAEAKRAAQAKEDLGLYKELISHGWTPPDDKAVEDGSVVRFKGLGYLKPPRFDKAKAFELKLETMETDKELARLRFETQKVKNIGDVEERKFKMRYIQTQIDLLREKAKGGGSDYAKAFNKKAGDLEAQLAVASKHGGIPMADATSAIVTPEIYAAKEARRTAVVSAISRINERIQSVLTTSLKGKIDLSRNMAMLTKKGESMMEEVSKDITTFRGSAMSHAMNELYGKYRELRNVEEGARIRQPREEILSVMRHASPDVIAWQLLHQAAQVRDPGVRWEIVLRGARDYASVRGTHAGAVMDQVARLVQYYEPGAHYWRDQSMFFGNK